LYIPVEKYHRTLFELKIRNGEYLCELLGVHKAVYRFNHNCREIVETSVKAQDSAHATTGQVSNERTQASSHDNQHVKDFPKCARQHVLMTPSEFQTHVKQETRNQAFTLCPAGFFDHIEVRNLLVSRLDGHLNEIQVTLEEESFDRKESKVMAKVQSLWESALRFFRSRRTTFRFSFHLWFYPVHELIPFHSLRNTSAHFDLVRKSGNFELLDDFVVEQLPTTMLLRYKSYRLLAPDAFARTLNNIQVYENIHGYLMEYLDTVSLSGLMEHNDEGFRQANQLWVMIYKHFKSVKPPSDDKHPDSSTCNDIRCKNTSCITCAQRTLFAYFLTVYNARRVQDKTPYILASGPENDLVKTMKTIIFNLKHLPNYEALADVVNERLAPFAKSSESSSSS
jgi:hypothetical protein